MSTCILHVDVFLVMMWTKRKAVEWFLSTKCVLVDKIEGSGVVLVHE